MSIDNKISTDISINTLSFNAADIIVLLRFLVPDFPQSVPVPFLSSAPLHGMTFHFLSVRNYVRAPYPTSKTFVCCFLLLFSFFSKAVDLAAGFVLSHFCFPPPQVCSDNRCFRPSYYPYGWLGVKTHLSICPSLCSDNRCFALILLLWVAGR